VIDERYVYIELFYFLVLCGVAEFSPIAALVGGTLYLIMILFNDDLDKFFKILIYGDERHFNVGMIRKESYNAKRTKR
jgi:hypothetical protein